MHGVLRILHGVEAVPKPWTPAFAGEAGWHRRAAWLHLRSRSRWHGRTQGPRCGWPSGWPHSTVVRHRARSTSRRARAPAPPLPFPRRRPGARARRPIDHCEGPTDAASVQRATNPIRQALRCPTPWILAFAREAETGRFHRVCRGRPVPSVPSPWRRPPSGHGYARDRETAATSVLRRRSAPRTRRTRSRPGPLPSGRQPRPAPRRRRRSTRCRRAS